MGLRLAVAGRLTVAAGLMALTMLVVIQPAQASAQPAPLQWYSATSPIEMDYWDAGQLDSYAEQALPFFGGTAPYAATLVSGNLPTGLTLESNGVVAGNALSAQHSLFTVQVTDSSTPPETITGQVQMFTGDSDTDQTQIESDDALLLVPGTGELGSAFVEAHALGLNPLAGASGEPNPIVGAALAELESLGGTVGCDVYAYLPFRGCPLP